MVGAAAAGIGRGEMHSQTEYLDLAKELRNTAEQVSDARAHDYLMGAAEAYERMARQELETGPFSRCLIPNFNRAH